MIFIAGFIMGAATVVGGLVIAACMIWQDLNT